MVSAKAHSRSPRALKRASADAGSIEQNGIELAVILAVILAAASAVVMRSSCYDSVRKRA